MAPKPKAVTDFLTVKARPEPKPLYPPHLSGHPSTQEGFPYNAALKHWEDAAGVRGRYNML